MPEPIQEGGTGKTHWDKVVDLKNHDAVHAIGVHKDATESSGPIDDHLE
jgi:hypothetical protein